MNNQQPIYIDPATAYFAKTYNVKRIFKHVCKCGTVMKIRMSDGKKVCPKCGKAEKQG